MIDVHIIVMPDRRRDWAEQCLDSVSDAAALAGFPVYGHVVEGVPGHIGKARAAGYALGDQPYVTFVDDDDYVLPHAFSQMADALRAGVSAVCTPELTLQNGQYRRGADRHHLIAYRRDGVIDHAAWVCCGDVAQMRAIGSDALALPEPGYVHRLYMDSKARCLRRHHLDELRRSRG